MPHKRREQGLFANDKQQIGRLMLKHAPPWMYGFEEKLLAASWHFSACTHVINNR